MESGVEQRRQKWTFPKFDVTLTWNVRAAANIQMLYTFYMARKGAYEAFYFYTYDTEKWAGLYVGVGDGTTTIFDLPGKTTSLRTVYINGVSTESLSYLTGGGTESADRVQFDTAPAAGEIISCDFTGYMRIKCRFAEDGMDRKSFTSAIFSTGLKLKGLHG